MKTLYYIHDPMCSWCWGFSPVRQQLQERLPQSVHWQPLLGGLAPDSDEPMPTAMQDKLIATWQRIHQLLGTEFNHDFWLKNEPRRSTYPACRAVLIAQTQSEQLGEAMVATIQRAYYLEARNPSDDNVLTELANGIGLDEARFRQLLNAPATQAQLEKNIHHAKSLNHDGFPSLRLVDGNQCHAITLDYTNAEPMLAEINALL